MDLGGHPEQAVQTTKINKHEKAGCWMIWRNDSFALLARIAREFSSMRRGVPLGILERHTPIRLLRMLRR
jgi:hypothetical protein